MKKRRMLIGLTTCLMLCFCHVQAQHVDNNLSTKNKNNMDVKHKNKPDIKVKVNKQYDKKGNLVQYDSTYSYTYSSPEGNSILLNNDSVFNRFKEYFHQNQSSMLKDNYNNMFLNDSLFKYDFFNNDYFLKRFQLNQKKFENMFKSMDSLKQKYFQKNYPDGHPQKVDTSVKQL